jgi:galactokinase
VRIWSENFSEWDEFDLGSIESNPARPWSNYVRGVALMLRKAGLAVTPVQGIIFGDVPIGAGLSSSAAIEVASALALCPDAAKMDRKELALLCQRAENQFVGVNCGIMDQFVSLHAEREHAVLIDCRSLDYKLLPLDTSRASVVVCNTMVHHELGSSAYNERRATCEGAARTISRRCPGVKQLRDVSSQMLESCRDLLDEVVYRRARHAVTEDKRTLEAVGALEAVDLERFGRLMNASHESLRDDYAVSCEELDLMVQIARRQPGTLGARLTGGGFGGCTVNLVERAAAGGFVAAVSECYQRATGIKPEIYQFGAVQGASIGKC